MLTETKRVSITKLRPSAYFPIFGTRHSRAVRGHPRRGEKVLNTRLKNVTTAQATYIVFFFKESGFCLRQRLISLLTFFYHLQEELKDWLKQKQDLQSEIAKIQTLKSNEEDDLLNLRQQKSDMEMYIYDLEIKKQSLEMDGLYSRTERQELRNAPDRTEVEVAFTSDRQSDKSEVDNSQNYHTSQQHVSHQTTPFSSSDSYQMTYNNSDNSINNSYLHINHQQRSLSSETLSTNQNSSTLHEDSTKEDNTVVSLRRERNELESQIYDMRIQLTRLHAEVTSLENRRTVLETVHREYATVDLEVKLTKGHVVGVDTDQDCNTARSMTEVTVIVY